MKPANKIILLGLTCFVLINVFEAAQQQYYITRFQLAGTEQVSFWYLLQNHALRWLLWGIMAIPLFRFVSKHPIQQEQFTLSLLGKYASLIILAELLALAMMSGFQLLYDGSAWIEFYEYFQFFTYQKIALFTSAYLGLIILIHLHLHQAELELKVVELSTLKKENKQLYRDLKTQAFQDSTPLIHVKIGNKLKAIPLVDISWIQSDDYCVRIHTKTGQSYLLRKSMKAMEKELAPKGFLRIHRNSIVNMAEVDSFIFQEEPRVKLKQGDVFKIANSRIPQIKEVLAKV